MQTINVRLVHSACKTGYFVDKTKIGEIEQKEGRFFVSFKWASTRTRKNDYVDAVEFVSEEISEVFMYLGLGVHFVSE